MTDDLPPPLVPEISAWALVDVDKVGPARLVSPGRAGRTVIRADGSRLDVIYDATIDQRESPELAIAAMVNLLVMAGDLRVLDPKDVGPVDLPEN